jgi:hypothetical protein
LDRIQDFFGVGSICISKRNNQIIYTVSSIKDLNNVIIPHFDKYPLNTPKKADFLLFKLIIDLMNKKEHLHMKGLIKIIEIKASLN